MTFSSHSLMLTLYECQKFKVDLIMQVEQGSVLGSLLVYLGGKRCFETYHKTDKYTFSPINIFRYKFNVLMMSKLDFIYVIKCLENKSEI